MKISKDQLFEALAIAQNLNWVAIRLSDSAILGLDIPLSGKVVKEVKTLGIFDSSDFSTIYNSLKRKNLNIPKKSLLYVHFDKEQNVHVKIARLEKELKVDNGKKS